MNDFSDNNSQSHEAIKTEKNSDMPTKTQEEKLKKKTVQLVFSIIFSLISLVGALFLLGVSIAIFPDIFDGEIGAVVIGILILLPLEIVSLLVVVVFGSLAIVFSFQTKKSFLVKRQKFAKILIIINVISILIAILSVVLFFIAIRLNNKK